MEEEKERERKGFRERKREFLEREALRLCVCERVKKSLVLFGERKRERGLPRNLNIKKRERELEFFCFCFFLCLGFEGDGGRTRG